MKLLALDTATEACSVSLLVGNVRLDRYLETDRGHAEHLLPMVESLLAEASIGLSALDAIAFGRGPGGFTGVRLAASVAQGLAFGAGVGVVLVSDLAAVARRALDLTANARCVLVANDARMREVYWSHFQGDVAVTATLPERATPASEVVLPVLDPGLCWVAAGRGLMAWPELAERCRAADAVLYPDLLPRAAEILALAQIEVAASRVRDPADALPVYVRDRVAEPL